MLTTQIELPLEKLAEFCRRWKIVKLEVFGSILRDDFRSDSDVDFLYTPGESFRREHILSTAQPVYVER